MGVRTVRLPLGSSSAGVKRKNGGLSSPPPLCSREDEIYKLRFPLRRLRRLPLGFAPPLGPPHGRSKERSPPPPEGCEGRRGGRSSAWLTRRFLPSSSYPSKRSTAAGIEAGSVNSTKANPRGRPVALSDGRKTSTSSPTSEKSASNSPRVVSKFKFPTKILFPMMPSSRVSPHQRRPVRSPYGRNGQVEMRP